MEADLKKKEKTEKNTILLICRSFYIKAKFIRTS